VDAFAALALVLGASAWSDARGGGRSLSRIAPAAAACAVTAAFTVPILALLREGRQFYGGGQAGFFEDTVKTTVWYSFERAPYGWARPLALGAVLLGITFAGLTGAALLFRRGKSPAERAALGLVALPFLAAGAAALQTALFGTATLRDRSALLFVPLLAAALAASLAVLARRRPRVRLAVSGASLALALLALLHLGRVANTRESFLWWFDADDRRVVDDLTRLHGNRPIRLGVTWYFEPSLNFYRVTRGLDWLRPITRDSPFGDFDYSYFLETDVPEALRRGWVPVARYEQTRSLLARAP